MTIMTRHACRPMWVVALVFSVSISVSHTQAQELARGTVIEKVICQVDAGQSYALYLPSTYSPEKRWPILYALDPGARGRLPVDRFKEASERHGYIVAGSNNSRNGPMEVAVAAIRAMLNDTRSRFSIDDRRIYFTGFSGGARLAVAVASSYTGLVAGVIGSGAGFPPQIKPSATMPFVYFGVAGIEDFNFVEMRRLNRTLDGLGVVHRFAVFQGGHEWPPQEVCLDAIEWIELQAMRSGILAQREPFVDALFQRAAQTIAADESAGRVYEAFLGSAALASDFKGLRDVSAYQRKADQLKGTRDVQQSSRNERDEEENQYRWMARLMRLKENYRTADEREQVLLELTHAISDLRKKAERKEDSADRLIARRVRDQFFVELRQEAANYFESQDFERAAHSLSVATQVAPDNPRLFYNLACALSRGGRRSDALAALKTAVDKGFADLTSLETDSDLDQIRKEAAFQRMLASLRSK